MKKYLLSLFFIFVCILLIGCTDPNEGGNEGGGDDLPTYHECLDNQSEWIDDVPFTCDETGDQHTECTICGELVDFRTITKKHEYEEKVVKELTCTENGETHRICKNCGKTQILTDYAKGHVIGRVVQTNEKSENGIAIKKVYCSKCNEVMNQYEYVNNGSNRYGQLKVVGADLVNQAGMKVQLYGLSTHGLQWFGRYANFDTIAAIQESFGINVIRFAFYTDENGYCDGGESKKQAMLEDLKRGVDAATKLGLYVIIDWHMVGAENDADKNPLTYLEESKEFFSYISEHYKRQKNILYEIMNEPNGSTTWADCKKYANEVIPCIRKNTDAVILVGNPHWTADLNSVMKDPLKGYDNIMYTYHFYAADHRSTSQVVSAYDAGFPVFISEYGFMDSDGDGNLNLTSGENWLKILDERNISYVAWNISNSKGSASIFKQGSDDMTDVSDENLKEWGIYLKGLYRKKSGLDK